jgi:hypothetical protein
MAESWSRQKLREPRHVSELALPVAVGWRCARLGAALGRSHEAAQLPPDRPDGRGTLNSVAALTQAEGGCVEHPEFVVYSSSSTCRWPRRRGNCCQPRVEATPQRSRGCWRRGPASMSRARPAKRRCIRPHFTAMLLRLRRCWRGKGGDTSKATAKATPLSGAARKGHAAVVARLRRVKKPPACVRNHSGGSGGACNTYRLCTRCSQP